MGDLVNGTSSSEEKVTFTNAELGVGELRFPTAEEHNFALRDLAENGQYVDVGSVIDSSKEFIRSGGLSESLSAEEILAKLGPNAVLGGVPYSKEGIELYNRGVVSDASANGQDLAPTLANIDKLGLGSYVENDLRLGVRALGLFQAIGGIGGGIASSSGIVAGISLSPVSFGSSLLVTGAGVVGLTASADQFSAGFRTVITGEAQRTYIGEGVENLFGASAQASEFTAGLFTLSPFAAEASLFSGTTRALSTYNAASRTTYLEANSTTISLVDRAAELRQSLNVGGGRNLAVAQFEIDGATGELVGVSGQAARPGTVPSPTNRIFDTIQTGNNPRTLDAENKVLEQLAQQLNSTSRGVVNLHSELPVCVSCSNVITQFQKKFPGVVVNVTTGKP